MAKDMAIAQEFKWLAEMSFDANDFDNAGAGGRGELPDSLSIKDNVFTFKTAEGTTDAPNPRLLYFVFLGGKKPKSRALYQGAFNDEDLQAPVCTSTDGVNFEPGSAPPVITDPANPRCGQTTRNCRECPMAKWGSATSIKTGKSIPACKEHKDIVVKVLGVSGAWLFKLPPAAFTNWDKATAKLSVAIEADKAAHDGVTTLSIGNAVFSVSFGPGMGNLIFEPMGYLAKIPEELAQVAELRRDQNGIDKMLWGPEGTARKLQYEEGKAPRGLTQPIPQEDVLPLSPAKHAEGQEWLKNTKAAQNHIPEMAQAAAALEEKQEPVKTETKKTTKPAQVVDMKSLLAKMGLPEGL